MATNKEAAVESKTVISHSMLGSILKDALVERGVIPASVHYMSMKIHTPSGSIDPENFNIEITNHTMVKY